MRTEQLPLVWLAPGERVLTARDSVLVGLLDMGAMLSVIEIRWPRGD